jgi:hypothetical protein
VIGGRVNVEYYFEEWNALVGLQDVRPSCTTKQQLLEMIVLLQIASSLIRTSPANTKRGFMGVQ